MIKYLLMFSIGLGIVFNSNLVNAQYVSGGGSFPSQVVPKMNGIASDFAPRRSGVEAQANVKICIGSSGVYRITQSQLINKGIEASELIGNNMRLFCQTQEVAFQVSNAGLWTTNDYLLFYGTSHNGAFSKTNVYWLGYTGGTNLPMQSINASTNYGGSIVTTFWDRITYNRKTFSTTYLPWDNTFDHWFASVSLSFASASTSIIMYNPVQTGENLLNVCLRGYYPDLEYTTRITINGSNITTPVYYNTDIFYTSNSFSASLFSNGINRVYFRQTTTDADDRAWVVEYLLDYNRHMKACNDSLLFDVPIGTNICKVSGFSTNLDFYILNVSDPARPVVYTNWSITGSCTNYTLNFSVISTNYQKFYATVLSKENTPDMQKSFFRNLSTTNNIADYLMIASYEFRKPAYELLKHRQLTGLNAKIIPLDDLYNEFSYGIIDGDAIKQCIGYAYHHWKSPVPRYVCLIGDGADPYNRTGTNIPNTIPIHYGKSMSLYCPQDQWYVCVNNTYDEEFIDTMPDLAIGRIPVSTTTDLYRVVNKIKSFESKTPPLKATVVADKYDASYQIDFKNAIKTYINPSLIYAGYTLTEAYYDDLPTDTMRATIANTINIGTHLVTYSGHGNAAIWAVPIIWSTNDILNLTNTNYPIVAAFACNVGKYDGDCMAEVFLKTEHGAVAVVASSGLSMQNFGEILSEGFAREFTNRNTRLGDAMNAGFLHLWQYCYDADELGMYEIIGDPATRK